MNECRYMFQYVNTKKHVSEHSCSSIRVFLSILAYSAHFAFVFFSISNGINKCFDVSMQIQERMLVSIASRLVE